MENTPFPLEDRDGDDGLWEPDLDNLYSFLLKAHYSALLAFEPYLTACIRPSIKFLFSTISMEALMDASPKMWRKSTVVRRLPKTMRKRATEEESESILTMPLDCVVIYDYLLPSILSDYANHAPNEYAFICSGYAVNGVVTITNYYPCKMSLSTPVDCRLDEECASEILFEQVPASHNIICWSHVHPIERPSPTDIEAFDHYALLDEQGLTEKRSLGLIVSGRTHKISIYDTHDYRRPLRHFVKPFSAFGNRPGGSAG